MGIKKFIKDVTGITAAEEEARRIYEEQLKEEKKKLAAEKKVKQEEKKRKQREAEALLTPKELATKRKEPWVDVIGFKVNPDDIRFGFFEIDWNDLWVLKLKQEGYGADGDPDDEIIARWFRDILLSAAVEEGIVPGGGVTLLYATKALEITEKPLDYLCEDFAWGYLPYDLAAIASYHLGNFDDAVKSLATDKLFLI